MTEDLIFRGYEKKSNEAKRKQAQGLWRQIRKKHGEDLIQQYMNNRFKINNDYLIYVEDL